MSPWIRLQRDRLALACMGFLGGVLVLGLLAPDARRDNSASSGMITSTKTELQIPQ